jgi:hypothetical protein
MIMLMLLIMIVFALSSRAAQTAALFFALSS